MHRIVSAIAATAVTGALFTAVPSQAVVVEQDNPVEEMVQFCSSAWRAIETGHADKVREVMTAMPEKQRLVVSLVCYSYGRGRQDEINARV